MNIPKIKIDGETIKANENLKMKVWRDFLKLTTAEADDKTSVYDYLENAIKIIIIVFDNDKVNEKTIDENLGVSEVIPLAKECSIFMQTLTFAKLDKATKNAEADEEEK